jgi:hypothetical protein
MIGDDLLVGSFVFDLFELYAAGAVSNPKGYVRQQPMTQGQRMPFSTSTGAASNRSPGTPLSGLQAPIAIAHRWLRCQDADRYQRSAGKKRDLLATHGEENSMMTIGAKVAAVGAFLAGGVLVGTITFAAGAAHGTNYVTTTTTTTNPGKYESSAQFEAQQAWVQSIPSGGSSVALTIPSGDRLTITSAVGQFQETQTCAINATVGGTAVSYYLSATVDGTWVYSGVAYPTTAQPVYADSGSAGCPFGATLVGYLTPIH